MLTVEQRLLTEAIAGKRDTPNMQIPNGDTKHTAKLIDYRGTGLLVAMDDDFSVRSQWKMCPLALEIGPGDAAWL